MLTRIRSRLTYANVMSTFAAFVALSGGVAYAAEAWTGDDIVDGSITGADIRGSFPDDQQGFIDGSLTTQDIADGTIFPSDIADNTIGPADIQLVGSGDIGSGAVNSDHVADDSLSGVDINGLTGTDVVDESLGGADLIDGSVGAADIDPAARGLTQVTERIGRRTVSRGTQFLVQATCPAGYRITGGGFASNARDPEDIVIRGSYRRNLRVWDVAGKHVGGIGSPRIEIISSALCAR